MKEKWKTRKYSRSYNQQLSSTNELVFWFWVWSQPTNRLSSLPPGDALIPFLLLLCLGCTTQAHRKDVRCTQSVEIDSYRRSLYPGFPRSLSDVWCLLFDHWRLSLCSCLSFRKVRIPYIAKQQKNLVPLYPTWTRYVLYSDILAKAAAQATIFSSQHGTDIIRKTITRNVEASRFDGSLRSVLLTSKMAWTVWESDTGEEKETEF